MTNLVKLFRRNLRLMADIKRLRQTIERLPADEQPKAREICARYLQIKEKHERNDNQERDQTKASPAY